MFDTAMPDNVSGIRDSHSPHGTLGTGSYVTKDDVSPVNAIQGLLAASSQHYSGNDSCGTRNESGTENKDGSENECKIVPSHDEGNQIHHKALCMRSSQDTVAGYSRDVNEMQKQHTEKLGDKCLEIITGNNHSNNQEYHITNELGHRDLHQNGTEGCCKASEPEEYVHHCKNDKIPHSPIQHNVVSSTRTDSDLSLIVPLPMDNTTGGFVPNQIVGDDVESSMTSPTTEYPQDATHNLRKRRARITLPSRSRQRRETLQDMARPLKRWLYSHKHNPYPTKDDKIRLAHVSSMTLTQVSNWFANARRRLKNTVREPGMTWEDRIRCYNDHVVGKAELLSVSSMGSDFESEMGEELTECSAEPIGLPNGEGNNQGVCEEAKNNIMQRFLMESYQTTIQAGDCKPYTQDDQTPPTFQPSVSQPTHDNMEADNGNNSGSQWGSNEPPKTVNGEDESMYWKEVSAAMALTCLANSIQ